MNTHPLRQLAISDSGFIFDPSSGYSYTANDTALFMLQCIKEGFTEKEILDKIISDFEIDSAQAERDLQDFIIHLREFSLISE